MNVGILEMKPCVQQGAHLVLGWQVDPELEAPQVARRYHRHLAALHRLRIKMASMPEAG